jgi:hypothetical protein
MNAPGVAISGVAYGLGLIFQTGFNKMERQYKLQHITLTDSIVNQSGGIFGSGCASCIANNCTVILNAVGVLVVLLIFKVGEFLDQNVNLALRIIAPLF